MAELCKAYVNKIVVGERHRTLNKAKLEALAKSMSEIGLQTPISIYEDDIGELCLSAGLHRLEAAKHLGWRKIDANLIDLTPTRREMWEIAENLHRIDLTKAQRGEHVRKYAALLKKARKEEKEAAKNQVRQNGAPEIGYKKPPPQEKGIATQIAEETGLSVRTVQRDMNPQVAPAKPQPVTPRARRSKAETQREIFEDNLKRVVGSCETFYDLANVPADLSPKEAKSAIAEIGRAIANLHGLQKKIKEVSEG